VPSLYTASPGLLQRERAAFVKSAAQTSTIDYKVGGLTVGCRLLNIIQEREDSAGEAYKCFINRWTHHLQRLFNLRPAEAALSLHNLFLQGPG
jgi:hypothetical protein